jgi:hypothetical protein
LNLIGHFERTDSKIEVSQVFSNNPQASRLRGRPKNRWWKYVQTAINKRNIKNWKERSRNRAYWESPLRTGRSAWTVVPSKKDKKRRKKK